MRTILDLQKLKTHTLDTSLLGDSCSSSWSGCCNDTPPSG